MEQLRLSDAQWRLHNAAVKCFVRVIGIDQNEDKFIM
jgi:hypothetical protein